MSIVFEAIQAHLNLNDVSVPKIYLSHNLSIHFLSSSIPSQNKRSGLLPNEKVQKGDPILDAADSYFVTEFIECLHLGCLVRLQHWQNIHHYSK